jgi:putative ABC transport system permease protein
MRRVALKGLAWRRVRSVLTALAVVLGVAMISGTYVLTDTIAHAFDSIFNSAYKDTSAVISGRQVVSGQSSASATIPESLLPRVRRVPGVQTASGAIYDINGNSDFAKLLDKKGKVLGTVNAPTFAFGFDPNAERFNPLTLVTGVWARGPGQVVIDKGSASKAGYHVGDRIGVSAQGPVRHYTISGIARFGNVDSLGGATIGVFDVPAAQTLLHKEGVLDTIFLAADPSVAPEQLVSEVRPLLPASAQVKTGEEQAKSNSQDTKDAVNFIQYFLLAFAGIALLVGSFVIFNTLSITIAQRIREFATLRALGASRRQVLRSVLLEGLALGIFASVVGLLLGLALAKGLNAVFDALGLSLPQSGTVFKSRTVIVSLLVGTLVTLASAVIPALRATRIPPVAAVREGSTLPPSRIARHGSVLSTVLLALALAALLFGAFGGGKIATRLELVGLGCLLALLGVGAIARRVVRPITAVVGAPARRVGGTPGVLATENAIRNPARTASTAAALMIGLTLITLVATLGAGLRSSDRNTLNRQVAADYVMTSKNGFDQFSVSAATAVARAPGVTASAQVRNDNAKVFGKSMGIDGDEPGVARFIRLHWKQGSNATLAALGTDGAVVEKSFADKHHLRVGTAFAITTPDGKRASFTVRGIQAPRTIDKLDPLFAKVIVSRAAFDAAFPRPRNIYAFLDTAGGSSAAHTAALKSQLVAFPDARVQTKSGWVDTRSGGINKLLNLLYVLLALSVIVSLFGMINTLVLSVFERTRELGMLRAVGMTRRQVRAMVRDESVITALIGAALGLPLGVLLAALITKALSSEGVSFSLPVPSLVVFAIIAVLAGVLASLLPARRASRLNVLEALAYE